MHKEGYPLSSIGKLIGHYTREMYKDEEDGKTKPVEYPQSAGGGHIDTSRSQLNYQLGECHGVGWVKDRLKGVYSRPQDWNKPKMIDIVITLPEDEPPENAQAFFEASYRSLCKQFQRKNNIVGAWVHLDEAQPHMHFSFLPIVDKKMKKNPEVSEGISTKAYFPRKASLQEMHKITQDDVTKALGHRVAILNEATKQQGGNKSISELKTASKKAMERATAQKAGLDAAKDGISKGAEWFGFGKEYYKITPERFKVIWTYARAGAEAMATEKERQAELRNAKAKEKQADQEREAVQTQLAEAQRENAALKEKLSKAEILLEAPEAEQKEMKLYMEFQQHQFRDFADVVHREAVQAFAEAGQKVEPVLDTMGRAFEAVGVPPEAQAGHLRECVLACTQQARRFFKCREKGQEYRPPERVKSWWPEPQETDFSKQDEAPALIERLQRLVMFEITKEKRNLFQHFRAMEQAKAKSRGRGVSGGRK